LLFIRKSRRCVIINAVHANATGANKIETNSVGAAAIVHVVNVAKVRINVVVVVVYLSKQ
jgi:hypothetical protein